MPDHRTTTTDAQFTALIRGADAADASRAQ